MIRVVWFLSYNKSWDECDSAQCKLSLCRLVMVHYSRGYKWKQHAVKKKKKMLLLQSHSPSFRYATLKCWAVWSQPLQDKALQWSTVSSIKKRTTKCFPVRLPEGSCCGMLPCMQLQTKACVLPKWAAAKNPKYCSCFVMFNPCESWVSSSPNAFQFTLPRFVCPSTIHVVSGGGGGLYLWEAAILVLEIRLLSILPTNWTGL